MTTVWSMSKEYWVMGPYPRIKGIEGGIIEGAKMVFEEFTGVNSGGFATMFAMSLIDGGCQLLVEMMAIFGEESEDSQAKLGSGKSVARCKGDDNEAGSNDNGGGGVNVQRGEGVDGVDEGDGAGDGGEGLSGINKGLQCATRRRGVPGTFILHVSRSSAVKATILFVKDITFIIAESLKQYRELLFIKASSYDVKLVKGVDGIGISVLNFFSKVRVQSLKESSAELLNVSESDKDMICVEGGDVFLCSGSLGQSFKGSFCSRDSVKGEKLLLKCFSGLQPGLGETVNGISLDCPDRDRACLTEG
ncbi:hypothetical protein K474DRAFT_1679451 [Panus rudis PR-1116 ss-1]|nr:hypothetical protein K474DRAFT_1679451 [Panus rudis PR-1116 ss-1]